MPRTLLPLILIAIILLLKPVAAEERLPGGISTSLALKIGERLHRSQKQGCATCHNLDGTGGARAGAANLRKPSKWKSTLIAKKVAQLGLEGESTRSVAVGLILHGAEKWNAEFYDKPEYSRIEDKIFFDKRMIGVHSTALKTNRKMAKRLLRKNKKRVASKDLLRLMAESVYLYLEQKLFLEEEK